MTRKEYIDAVKVKLEEISPFDEPDSFIADGDDAANTEKPIISYIDKSLDEAAHNCLKSLPLTLLHADVVRSNPTLAIASDGVASFDISPNTRFIRFRHADLKRDITAFITSEDPLYLVQQNKHTRGGLAKPVAVIAAEHDGTSSGKMEIYSLKPTSDTAGGYLLGIDTSKHPDDRSTADPAFTDNDCVKSPIEEYIVLECAAMVASILGDTATTQICQAQFQAKLQSERQ